MSMENMDFTKATEISDVKAISNRVLFDGLSGFQNKIALNTMLTCSMERAAQVNIEARRPEQVGTVRTFSEATQQIRALAQAALSVRHDKLNALDNEARVTNDFAIDNKLAATRSVTKPQAPGMAPG